MFFALAVDSTYTWWIPWALGVAVGCFFFFYVRPGDGNELNNSPDDH